MIFYRGYCVEWIENRQDFRVFKPEAPEQTVAYEDSFRSAKEDIDFNLDRFNEE